MIIEIGQGLMTILVLAFIFTLLIAPELVILFVVGVIGVIGIGASGKSITVKGPDGVIFQTTVKDVNSTGVAPNSEVVEFK